MARTSTSSPSGRPRRQSVGKRERIRVRAPEGDGYKYRLVNNANDGGSRVDNLLDLGYEIVSTDRAVRENDRRVDDASPIGTASSNINLGKGDKGTIMRIKQEYWEEDQIAKHAKQESLEQTMKESVREAADYGSFRVDVQK